MKKSASKPSKKAPAIAIVIETSKPDKAMRKNKDMNMNKMMKGKKGC